MATIMPASELVRRAAAWLAEQRALYPEKSLAALLDEALDEGRGVGLDDRVDLIEDAVDVTGLPGRRRPGTDLLLSVR